jgi:hypothetical protein
MVQYSFSYVRVTSLKCVLNEHQGRLELLRAMKLMCGWTGLNTRPQLDILLEKPHLSIQLYNSADIEGAKGIFDQVPT